MRARIHAFALRVDARASKESHESDGSRTEYTVGGSPIAASARRESGSRFHEWVGIFTVRDPSFSVLIFLIFLSQRRARRASSPPPSAFVLSHSRSRLPHTASRGPPTIDANRDRDRSRKNSIDANPRSERLERGRASTQRTRETTQRERKNATRGNSRRRTHLGLRDAMTTNGTLTPFKEGTIKHACFVALERAGAEGLTVRARDERRAPGDSRRGGCPMGALRLVLRHGPLLVRTCGGFAFRAPDARALTAD